VLAALALVAAGWAVALGASAPSTEPAATPADEALLAFEWYAGRDFKDVVTVRQDGTDRRALAADIEPRQHHADVDWSPDGQTIAFDVGEWYGGSSIWTVGVDGQSAAQLIGPSDACRLGVAMPAWSPDGGRLMYVCQDGESGDDPVGILTVLDLATGESSEITTVRVPDELLFPRWSNDGKTAVVELRQWDTAPEEDVWVGSQVATVPILGGDVQRLTPADMWAGDPDWSPTSDRIVFGTYGIGVKDMSKPSTVYTMRPDGSEQTVIATSPGDGQTRITGPRWTPDGQRLLVSIAVGEGMSVNDVKLAFLDLDGTLSRIPFGSEDLSGVAARLQP
jgi:Tol biopolymer transport system component